MRRSMIIATVLTALVGSTPAWSATVDGVNINWTSTGNGAQAVIFVHGWTCDLTSWQYQVPAISQRYRVITLDLPGHGNSESPKDGRFSMELFARAVEAVRSEAEIDKAVLVGHSMGAPVVRQYTLIYPQRVAGLVLVDGLVQLAGTPPVARPRMIGPEGQRMREGIARGMSSTATPRVQDHILKMMLGTSEAAADGAMVATWDQSWWTNDVVSVPVLGVYAEMSAVANPEGMKRLYSQLEYHVIPGTGHFLMMEKPQEFNRLLSDFLAKLEY
jgi:pimeloyl-ACP methyl ester carboxylesterase